jgi:hypothetical protein
MCVNGKMRPIETVPGIGGRRIEENDGGGELNYLMYYKNIYKYHNVPPLSTTIKR